MIKRNIKMVVTPEESKQVQEICFANGIVWGSGDRSVMFTHKPFLHISMGIAFGDEVERFKENSKEEVDAKFFIKTNGTCIEENQELEETPEQPTEAKPKQYMCFCPTKGKPKRIHQSLESAQEEAKRLCKSGLCDVMVLEVVSKYQAKVIVEEV